MPFRSIRAGAQGGRAGEGRPVVWVVDDSSLEGEQARAVLEAGCEVEVFDDGGRVVERLATSEVPDVIVLDWVMPDISGTDVCRYVRESPHGHAVPVLILTAYHEPAHVEAAFEAGANDYLAKPYAAAELRARVTALARAKELRARAEQAEGAVRLLLSELPDAVLLVDADCRVVYANDEGLRILAHGRDPVGLLLADLLPELDCDHLADVGPADVRLGDHVYAPHVRRLDADIGAGAILSLRDVTEARRREARRLDFYSMVAHELRTPLSAMLMRVDWLLAERRGPLAPAVRSDVVKIEARIRDLVALINDFLELARIESAGVGIIPAPFDMNDLAREVAEEFQQLAGASRLGLLVDPAPGRARLVADRRRVRQVLTNLLSNAVKFTQPGGRVEVRLDSDPDGAAIRVKDTGEGLAPELVPHLFERFRQADSSSTRAHGGVGLGLAIVRHLVEAHGGTVSAESAGRGKGSTFTVRLPVVARRRAPATVPRIPQPPAHPAAAPEPPGP